MTQATQFTFFLGAPSKQEWIDSIHEAARKSGNSVERETVRWNLFLLREMCSKEDGNSHLIEAVLSVLLGAPVVCCGERIEESGTGELGPCASITVRIEDLSSPSGIDVAQALSGRETRATFGRVLAHYLNVAEYASAWG